MPNDVNATTRSEPQFLTLREAAIFCRTSPDTIRRATLAGELKFFRLGQGRKRSPLFFRRDELLRWIAAREEESSAAAPKPRFREQRPMKTHAGNAPRGNAA